MNILTFLLIVLASAGLIISIYTLCNLEVYDDCEKYYKRLPEMTFRDSFGSIESMYLDYNPVYKYIVFLSNKLEIINGSKIFIIIDPIGYYWFKKYDKWFKENKIVENLNK